MNIAREIGQMIAPYAVPAIAAVLMYFAKKSGKIIESVTGKKNLEKAAHEIEKKQGIAYDAVRMAQDAFSAFHGETRLKHATEWMTNRVKQYGFTIDPAEIEGMCRSAFSDLVKELKADANAPAADQKKATTPKAKNPDKKSSK